MTDSLAPEAFRDWVREEVITDPDLEARGDTFAAMALFELCESLVFCTLSGRDATPVLSSPRAIEAYRAL